METNKHILFISSWYPNRSNPTHGIFNQHFAQAAAINNQVSVLHVCSDVNLKQEFEMLEAQEGPVFVVTVYYKKVGATFPGLSQWRKSKKRRTAFDLGYKHLQRLKGDPDLIQLNVVLPAGLDVYRLSKKHSLPYVVNEGWTGYMPEDGQYTGFLKKYFTKKILKGAKCIMPVSEDLRKAMLNNGLKGKYKVVHNVINTNYFVPAKKEYKDKIHFLHISTLDDRQKNVSGIIRAFYHALNKNPDLILKIVGDGEDRTKLENQVNELHLQNNILFCGRLMAEQLLKEMQAAEALIMFSNYESFCVVIAEAWACGIPVIASDAGGLSAEITPELGLLVKKRNDKQLSAAILNMAENLGKYRATDLHVFVENHFSQHVIGDQLTQIYNWVCSEKNA